MRRTTFRPEQIFVDPQKIIGPAADKLKGVQKPQSEISATIEARRNQ